jgi:hypothetical protein
VSAINKQSIFASAVAQHTVVGVVGPGSTVPGITCVRIAIGNPLMQIASETTDETHRMAASLTGIEGPPRQL